MPSSSVPSELSTTDGAPLTRLQSLRTPLLLLIFHRGSWCPFSTTWARGLSSIRALQTRLTNLNATAVLISSQSASEEPETAEAFKLTPARGLYDSVHVINDSGNTIAKRINKRAGRTVVHVDAVSESFVGGVRYPHGMVQPAVLVVRDMFGECDVVDYYTYNSSGPGDVNGGDELRPQACSTLRAVERMSSC